MFDFLFAELENSDTLLTNEIAIRSFEENLALCLLLGLRITTPRDSGDKKQPQLRAMCAELKSACAPMPECR
jgi:hypothetical protein